jgi:hypothetical protein
MWQWPWPWPLCASLSCQWETAPQQPHPRQRKCKSIDTRRYQLPSNHTGQDAANLLAAAGADTNDPVEGLCVYAQMKAILNTNNSAANSNSLPADQIKGLLDNLVAAKREILDLIPNGGRRAMLEAKFDAPLQSIKLQLHKYYVCLPDYCLLLFVACGEFCKSLNC